MKNLRIKIERMGAAIAFAEAGEAGTAMELMKNIDGHKKAIHDAAHKKEATSTVSLIKKMTKSFDGIMSAMAFAEAGEHDMALECLGESYTAEKQAAKEAGLEVQKSKSPGLAEKIGKVAEAVAFAEVGEHEHARSLMGDEVLQKKEKGRILVVGREYSFSDHLMNYATNMASRMGRDILALNVTHSDVGFRFLSTYHKTVKEDFQRHAEENAKLFKNKAATKGVAFEHVIRFGDPDRAIHSICEEIGQITYALAEPEITDRVHPAGAEGQWEIPVFCVVPQAA